VLVGVVVSLGAGVGVTHALPWQAVAVTGCGVGEEVLVERVTAGVTASTVRVEVTTMEGVGWGEDWQAASSTNTGRMIRVAVR
jgi:hypothetical protein